MVLFAIAAATALVVRFPSSSTEYADKTFDYTATVYSVYPTSARPDNDNNSAVVISFVGPQI